MSIDKNSISFGALYLLSTSSREIVSTSYFIELFFLKFDAQSPLSANSSTPEIEGVHKDESSFTSKNV